MSKIFEFRPGSYIDLVSGAVGVNTNGEWARTEKGLAWRGNGSEYVTYDHLTTLPEDFSIVCWFKRSETSTDDKSPFGSLGTNLQAFRIRDNIWSYYIIDNNGNITTNTLHDIDDTEWHCAILTFDYDGVTTGYLDGVQGDEVNSNSDTYIDISEIRVGLSGVSDYFNGDVSYAAIYDHILTEKEISKLYGEFLRASPVTRVVE